MRRVGQFSTLAIASSSLGFLSQEFVEPFEVNAKKTPVPFNQRQNDAFQMRQDACLYWKKLNFPNHLTNGDEELYSEENFYASNTRGLPHDAIGEVDPSSYLALLNALESGEPTDFAAIPMGSDHRNLANPQAAYAFELIGPDSHHSTIDAPPAFSSMDAAAEIAEVYWQAMTRDVSFNDYNSSPLIQQAADDLSQLFGYEVTPDTLYRGSTPSDLTGPYISQLLWMDIPFGATKITQKYRVPISGNDFVTNYTEWLRIQNGYFPSDSIVYDSNPRYIINGRDLGEYVHKDFPYQAYLSACLILLGMGTPFDEAIEGIYPSPSEDGFVTFGNAHVIGLLARVSNCALKATWFQKWLVHRLLRPETFGGRIHNHLIGIKAYPIHESMLNSPILELVNTKYNSYLLPQAYPEGAPTHPSYPAGHAVIAGACTTILKAFFDESTTISDPIIPNSSGSLLEPYSGPELKVGGELNKLASNISLGRDIAGVHYRSDGIEGIKLGEEVAIGMLRDYNEAFNEDFEGLKLTKFDGSEIEVMV